MAKVTKKTKAEKLMEDIEEVEATKAEEKKSKGKGTVEVGETIEFADEDIIPIDEENISLDEEALDVELTSKNVRVRVKERFKCHIGGEWYYFEKNKVYSVPEEVKSILMQADKLLPM